MQEQESNRNISFLFSRDVCAVILCGDLSVWNSWYTLLSDLQQKNGSPSNDSFSTKLMQSNCPVYFICFTLSEALKSIALIAFL